ncbi:Thiol-disulfide isomerase or thioredoxin [Promicromonospora umidemergens]|uniref:TlpA disulfide reductase family protein n=1 Tax=Promicromonospora umidemergens TaxID=629679 RepID=A0ABP8X330_9MICO|nr:TlpA disulfide reductase family protein [Promicromonospora umidemergens]MCP2284987.1 Thiol-disulfide isomerase or thioredoxin [Promicromonospora umidemergens]
MSIVDNPPRGAKTPGNLRHGPAVVAFCAGLILLLAGCATAAQSGAGQVADQGFVSGDGSVRTWDLGDRDGPVRVTGTAFDGQEIDTDDWDTDVLILNTWYAACPPCRAEAPDLVAVAEQFEPDGVRFLGINTEDEVPTAEAFERTFAVPYPSIGDRSGRVVAELNGVVPLQAVPTTVVVDKDGMVAARVIGQIERSTLESLVEDVLAEDEPTGAGS